MLKNSQDESEIDEAHCVKVSARGCQQVAMQVVCLLVFIRSNIYGDILAQNASANLKQGPEIFRQKQKTGCVPASALSSAKVLISSNLVTNRPSNNARLQHLCASPE
jgi:hypothetical protein